jgi:hypothetical protein
MNNDDFAKHQLEHAQWRVEFLASLLQSHRLRESWEPAWEEKNEDYLERIAVAKEELEHAERMFLERELEHAGLCEA